jgi:hypothetical protein
MHGVDRQDETMSGRGEIQPDHIAQLGGKARPCGSLKRRTRCGCRRCAARIRCTEHSDTPVAAAIARPVQCVASLGGLVSVSPTLPRAGAIRNNRSQSLAVRRTHLNPDPFAHDASSHILRQYGIL